MRVRVAPAHAAGVRAQRPVATVASLFVAIIVCLAVSGCSGSGLAVPADDAWVRTQDDATGISVELPGTAEMQTQDIPTPDGGILPANMWTVNLDGNRASLAFMVAEVDGPINLNGALEGMATNVGGTVAQQSETSHDGHAAIDGTIELTQNDTEGSVYARVVDGGAAMVVVESVGHRSDAETLAQLQERLVGSLSVPGT
jgi:hypothetical protein